MGIDVAVRLSGCVTVVTGFTAACLCGRADEQKQNHPEEGQRKDQPIPMEHVHGGDPDDL